MLINFPLYVIRQYDIIVTIGEYKLIQTYKNRYVLDYAEVPKGTSYLERRIMLMRAELPYMLYPVNKKLTSLTDIFNSKYRKFIDATGKLVTYTPSKFHRLECKPIVSRTLLKSGKLLIKVQGIPTLLEIDRNTTANYARVIKYKGMYVVFDVLDNKVKTIRKKI
jgi:hypothetical protein